MKLQNNQTLFQSRSGQTKAEKTNNQAKGTFCGQEHLKH